MKKILAIVQFLVFGIIVSTCGQKEIRPEITVASVNISPSSVNISVGETVQLLANVQPESASGLSVVWASSNESVATVTNSGIVTAISNGEAFITATVGGKTASGSVIVSAGFFVQFEDDNFKAYCVKQFDTNHDGEISTIEASKVTRLEIQKRSIVSLKGIEFFTSLEHLSCYKNEFMVLDVSKNTALKTLDCSQTDLASLDVSKNAALTALTCSSTLLTSLDVSKNTALTFLDCSKNQLMSLDVSKNTALTILSCFSTQLTTLDLSKNTLLEELYCMSNDLTSLDVSKNTALKDLSCSYNNLMSLDVSKNTALVHLSCCNNGLTSLDVSKNTALFNLQCYDNKLTSLDVSFNKGLRYLSCGNQPSLKEIWLSLGQSIPHFEHDSWAVIKYK